MRKSEAYWHIQGHIATDRTKIKPQLSNTKSM